VWQVIDSRWRSTECRAARRLIASAHAECVPARRGYALLRPVPR